MANITETIVNCSTGETSQVQREDTRTAVVPQVVSGVAGRAIMKFHGLHDTILAAIAAIPDLKTQLLAEQGYLTAATFSRDDVLLNTVFAGLGKSDAERDAYFVEAGELSRTV